MENTNNIWSREMFEEAYDICTKWLGEKYIVNLNISYDAYLQLVRMIHHIEVHDMIVKKKIKKEYFNTVEQEHALKYMPVITEIEGDFTVEVSGDRDKNIDFVEQYLYHIEMPRNPIGKRLTVETMNIIQSDLWYIDLMYDAFYESQVVENFVKYEQEIIASKGLDQIQFDAFRRNGEEYNKKRTDRKNNEQKDNKKNETNKRSFSSLGYPFPLDCEIETRIGRGKQTKFQTCIANVFRLFICSKRFINLYTKDELTNYRSDRIWEIIIDSGRFNLKLSEWYMLERILGINTVLWMNKLLKPILVKVTKKQVQEKLAPGISRLASVIAKWPGVYSRIEFIKLLEQREFPEWYYTQEPVNQAYLKISNLYSYAKKLTEDAKDYYDLYQFLYRGLFWKRGIAERSKEMEDLESFVNECITFDAYTYIENKGSVIKFPDRGYISDLVEEYSYQIIQRDSIKRK